MLVHSFSTAGTGFTDYAEFLKLFNLTATKGTVQRAATLHDPELYSHGRLGQRCTSPNSENQ